MSRYVPKTYKNYRVARIILKIFLALVLTCVILFVALFFGLKKYIVYTPDGLRLDIPFLVESTESVN